MILGPAMVIRRQKAAIWTISDDQLLREFRMEDNSSLSNYTRMEPFMFDEILHRVSPRIQKSDTHFRKALESGLELEGIM